MELAFSLEGSLWLLGILGSIGGLTWIVKKYILSRIENLSKSVELWIDILGWDSLLAAYIQAQKEVTEYDAVRDKISCYIVIMASRWLNLTIPENTIKLIVELVMTLGESITNVTTEHDSTRELTVAERASTKLVIEIEPVMRQDIEEIAKIIH